MAYVQGINAWIRLSIRILFCFFVKGRRATPALHGGVMWISGLMEEVLSQKRNPGDGWHRSLSVFYVLAEKQCFTGIRSDDGLGPWSGWQRIHAQF